MILNLFACQGEIEEEGKIAIPLIEIEWEEEYFSKSRGILFYQGKAFSGKLIERYQNNQLKRVDEYLEGKQYGRSIGWYSNGSKQFERSYLNGKKNGLHEGWWPQGQLKFKYHFNNGIYKGELKEWHANGQILKEMHYDDSGKELDLKMWDEKGKIKVNYVVKKGRRYGLIGKKSCYTVKEPNHE